jgi:lysophospholipase L1-like esterase
MSRLDGKTVIVIGDSHTLGPAGTQFVQDLKDNGATVILDGRVGRSARDLVGKEQANVDRALTATPDLVVFWLGTNDGVTLATAAAFAQLRDEAVAAGVSEVWGVGPPSFSPDAVASDGSNMTNRSDANAATMQSVFGARFVDSRPITSTTLEPPDRTADLLHFNAFAGRAWGTGVAAQILASSASGVSLGWKIASALGFSGAVVYGLYRWSVRR